VEPARIALAQINAHVGSIDRNLETIADFTSKAASKNAEIICFPELAVCGYNSGHAARLAETIPGPTSTALISMAKRNNITILAGMVEQSGRSKPYITQLLATPEGTIHTFRKVHLGKKELEFFSPGENITGFSYKNMKVGVGICWDMHFPEMATILSLRGCEIIFAPHASPAAAGDRKKIWLKYLPARAYDNAVYVAACNLVGNDGYQKFSGGLLVLDPKGNIVKEFFEQTEQLLVVDLDAKVINSLRYGNEQSMGNAFYLNGRRPHLYGELVEKTRI